MNLPPLTQGRLLRRYKRFLADVALEGGETVVAHCPNTGAMTSCWEAGCRAQISHSDNPKRKLAWTLERTDMGQGWIGVNTGSVNGVIAEGIASGAIPALSGYRALKREFTVDLPGHPRSRLDLFLSQGEVADAFIEVKNATLLDGECIRFPDAVSARGLKHLELLAALAETGVRAVMVYAVNRPEGTAFAPADAIDPAYGRRLREVTAQGVEVIAVRILHEENSSRVGSEVAVELE